MPMLGLCALMYVQDFKNSVAFLVSVCSYPSCFDPYLVAYYTALLFGEMEPGEILYFGKTQWLLSCKAT